MGNTLELNRLEFSILKCLYDSGCVNPYHSMTITELLGRKANDDIQKIKETYRRKICKKRNHR